jgi:chemotaxis methyl-accepting protein methylase
MITEDDEELEQLKVKIHGARGFNCHFYKDKCLRRRLAVRMRARGAQSFAAYGQLLDEDSAEYDLLVDTLTINVTKFFRNDEMWSAFGEHVLPALFESRATPTRIWSAGCASGEEAYSVSIALHQHAERENCTSRLRHFRIVGTDIDQRSLDAARRAEFSELSLSETPEWLRERWFSTGPPYRLADRARQNVSFHHQDLLTGEPERDQTLILCRNVIIYFERDVQERLFEKFYDSLIPGGYLVLGKVETLLGPTRSLFRAVSNRERIFQKPH